MSDQDFASYWKVDGGIKGQNGPLIELRYDRGDDHRDGLWVISLGGKKEATATSC